MAHKPGGKPELKPCPFCGRAAALEETHGTASPVTFSVGCLDESCIGFPSTTFQTRKDAITAWNRRA
jgi:Lar family restriction alleviation protein